MKQMEKGYTDMVSLARNSWMQRSSTHPRMLMEERFLINGSGADDGDPGNRRWSGTGGKYTNRLVSGK